MVDTAEISPSLEDRIQWVLAHPDMSDWLKQSLSSSLGRDPVGLLNDLEMLNILLKPKCEMAIKAMHQVQPDASE